MWIKIGAIKDSWNKDPNLIRFLKRKTKKDCYREIACKRRISSAYIKILKDSLWVLLRLYL